MPFKGAEGHDRKETTTIVGGSIQWEGRDSAERWQSVVSESL